MATFLNRLWPVLSALRLSQPDEEPVAHHNARALAMILVEIVRVDGRVQKIETENLAARLTKHLGLHAKDATALVASALRTESENFKLDELAMELRRGLDREDRGKIIALAWDIAAIDGEVHEFEEGFVFRLGRLLGLNESEVLKLRPASGEEARHDG